MLGPLASLIVGVASVVTLILYFRFHAFLALIVSAVVVALASDRVPVDEALPLVTGQFGEMMGGIGILLALAAIIGKCLMDSGAAERIVRAFTRLFGRGNEHYSLLAGGFVLSVPVFFDTVFYLLAPLTRAAYARRKRDYVLIIGATVAGAVLTHALVPPTPGPVAVAEMLGVSIALTMMTGVLASIVPLLLVGVAYVKWINRVMPIEPRAVMGVSGEELESASARDDRELPPLWFSLLPFVLPVLLLAFSSVFDLARAGGAADPGSWMANQTLADIVHLLGDKNVAFFLGALVSIALVISARRETLGQAFKSIEPAIAGGAVIALITSSGGAFGKALAAAGIGDAIAAAAAQWNISILVLAYLSATLIRVAQGSATVAMITSAGIIAPAIAAGPLEYHSVYLVAVIGFGATGFSWMNDSGFWIFSQLTGLTETETLKTWTALLSVMSVAGFVWVWILTWILPMA